MKSPYRPLTISSTTTDFTLPKWGLEVIWRVNIEVPLSHPPNPPSSPKSNRLYKQSYHPLSHTPTIKRSKPQTIDPLGIPPLPSFLKEDYTITALPQVPIPIPPTCQKLDKKTPLTILKSHLSNLPQTAEKFNRNAKSHMTNLPATAEKITPNLTKLHARISESTKPAINKIHSTILTILSCDIHDEEERTPLVISAPMDFKHVSGTGPCTRPDVLIPLQQAKMDMDMERERMWAARAKAKSREDRGSGMVV